jgi:hypothetical protein
MVFKVRSVATVHGAINFVELEGAGRERRFERRAQFGRTVRSRLLPAHYQKGTARTASQALEKTENARDNL